MNNHRLEQPKSYHVYILQSIPHPTCFYTDFTEDLDQRLGEHNRGQYHHTARYRPWRIKTVISFSDKDKTMNFEQYLKASSGRAFAKKRL
ncbi:GIY-YIG nuclease family protein [candidate division CSSED10-310 bacterium]|uniref:GIY-YIG nuclease family protein n=1 Tax=candidate division CSSED10-310 bacterium TaxID=2855610 RepID=A0ABV6Z302_UNCC1